ncbi:MAG: hypothetical protein AB1736_15415 [Chloroflexota bacterium]
MSRLRAVIAVVVLVTLSCAPEQSSEAPTGLTLREPPGDSVGLVPTFRWEAVEGADHYRLVLLDASDFPVWAWEGTDTEVTLLGFEHDPELGGPVVGDDSTWSVAALAADGHVVAISEAATISPGVAAPSRAPEVSPTPAATLDRSGVPEDPCTLLARADLEPFFGEVPDPQVVDLGTAVECRVEEGVFGYVSLTVQATTETSVGDNACRDCTPIDAGDDARGRLATSGGRVVAISDGLLLAVEVSGLGDVTLDQLGALIRAAIGRL